MSNIFQSSPGQMVVIRSASGENRPALLRVQDFEDADEIIVTSYQTKAQVAYQAVPTIGGPQYIYPFGDRPYQIELGVVVMPYVCAGDQGSSQNGFRAVWNFYHDKRIRPGAISPVTVTFADTTIRGLVVGLASACQTGQGSAVINATISMIGWVEAHQGGGSSGSGGIGAFQDAMDAAWFGQLGQSFRVRHGQPSSFSGIPGTSTSGFRSILPLLEGDTPGFPKL